MALTRVLVNWFCQHQHLPLLPSDRGSDAAAADSHEAARRHVQAAAGVTFGSLTPGTVSPPVRQTQSGSGPPVADHSADSHITQHPSLPSVTPPASLSPALLSTLFGQLAATPPAQRPMRADARPDAADSSDESIVGVADSAGNGSTVGSGSAADWQTFQADRRPSGPNTVPRPLPTFATLRGCVRVCLQGKKDSRPCFT